MRSVARQVADMLKVTLANYGSDSAPRLNKMLTDADIADTINIAVNHLTPRLDVSHWDGVPGHPVDDWRDEVADDDTRLGYLDWVENRMAQAEDEDEAEDEAAET